MIEDPFGMVVADFSVDMGFTLQLGQLLSEVSLGIHLQLEQLTSLMRCASLCSCCGPIMGNIWSPPFSNLRFDCK